MSIALSFRDDRAVVSIDGRFDFQAHSDFRKCSEEALAQPGVRTIEVGLAGVAYLDSSALGMLLLLREKALEGNRRVVLSGAGGLARQVLDVANFARLFEFI